MAVAALSDGGEPPPRDGRRSASNGAAAGRRRVVRLALGAALAPAIFAAWGQAGDPALEAGVKAAYLYKFIGYVEWPAGAFDQPESPIIIGVAGAEPVLAELERLLPGRMVQWRGVIGRRIRPGEPLDGVHVLFVGRAASAVAGPWLDTQAGKPVLVVTEVPDGLDRGGTINFLLVGGKVRFEASLPAAERAGLKLSARLLAVAERVVSHS